MAFSKRAAAVARTLGWLAPTPAEIGVGLLLVGLVWWGAIPHFERWRAAQVLEAEQQTIMSIRAALVVHHASRAGCPESLDECPDGSSAAECPFFGNVLDKAVSEPGWSRRLGTYRGPSGGHYVYDPSDCQIRQVPEPVDES